MILSACQSAAMEGAAAADCSPPAAGAAPVMGSVEPVIAGMVHAVGDPASWPALEADMAARRTDDNRPLVTALRAVVRGERDVDALARLVDYRNGAVVEEIVSRVAQAAP